MQHIDVERFGPPVLVGASPKRAGKALGFTKDQLEPGWVVPYIKERREFHAVNVQADFYHLERKSFTNDELWKWSALILNFSTRPMLLI